MLTCPFTLNPVSLEQMTKIRVLSLPALRVQMRTLSVAPDKTVCCRLTCGSGGVRPNGAYEWSDSEDDLLVGDETYGSQVTIRLMGAI